MPPVTVLAKPTTEQTQARLDSEHAAAELEVARLQNVRPSSPAQLAAAKETARLAGLRKKFTVAQHHKRDQRFFSGIHDKLIKMAAEFFRGSRDSSVSSFCFVVVSSSATGRSRTIQKVCLLPNLRANSLKVEKAESFLINLLSDPDSCIIPEFSDLSIIVSRLIAASHASGALEIACAAFKDKGPAETMRLLETSFFTALQVILGAQEASDRPYVSPGEDDVAFAEAVAAAAAVRRKQAEAEAEAAEAAEEAPGAGGEGGVRDGGVGTGIRLIFFFVAFLFAPLLPVNFRGGATQSLAQVRAVLPRSFRSRWQLIPQNRDVRCGECPPAGLPARRKPAQRASCRTSPRDSAKLPPM